MSRPIDRLALSVLLVTLAAPVAAQEEPHIHMLRFDTDGSLDEGFGDDGEVIDMGSWTYGAEAYDVDVQSDGKLLFAGVEHRWAQPGKVSFLVGRRNADGSDDQSFYGGGWWSDDGGAHAVTSHGSRIIAVGYQVPASNELVAKVVCLNQADGWPDATFGDAGEVQVGIAGWHVTATSVAVMPQSGRIVIAGTGTRIATQESRFFVARLNTDGTLDGTFSEDGIAMVLFPTGNAFGADVAVRVGATESIGYVAIAGTVHNGTSGQFGVALLSPTGMLLTSFDGDGRRLVTFPASNDQGANAIAIDGGGRIVVGGWANIGSPRFAVARMSQSGAFDATFSGDGRQTVNFSSFEAEFGSDIAIASGNAVVIAGSAYGGEPANDLMAIAYLMPDGSLNDDFSIDGKASFDAPNHQINSAFGVAIEADGQIVTAGVLEEPY